MDRTVSSLSESEGLRPEKPFAMAFAALALALAGCASGFGIDRPDHGQMSPVARVEEGRVIASRAVAAETETVVAASGALRAVAGGATPEPAAIEAGAATAFAYTVRLRHGELVRIAQSGDFAIANGTPVLVEYGQRARVIPQNVTIGY